VRHAMRSTRWHCSCATPVAMKKPSPSKTENLSSEKESPPGHRAGAGCSVINQGLQA